MPDHYEPFTPESVDEQIEQFMPTPEQTITPETELVMDMHDLYRGYAGTRDRVRQRLYEHMARSSMAAQAEAGTVLSLTSERQRLKREKTMYAIPTSPAKTYTFKPRMALVAATLVAALLVVALTVVAPLMRSLSNHSNATPGANPNTTSPTAVHTPKAVYITDGSGILKLDPNTGATLKTYHWPNKGIYQTGGTIEPYTLQMSGNLLYVGFKLINSGGHLIYGGIQAFDLNKGQMLWEFDGTTVQYTTLTLNNGTVYFSVDHPDITGRSLAFALRGTDGMQLHSYDLPLSIKKLVVAHGFLYAKDFGSLYGLNLATGAHWNRQGPQGVDQGYTDFQVANGVLYASAYNGSSSYFDVLNTTTGAQIRSTKPIPGRVFNFAIVQNIAYFGTDKPLPNVSGDNIGRFDAYDFSQFKVLWETTAPSVAQTFAVSNGTVYAVSSFPYAGGAVDPKLLAFNASNGQIRWNATAGDQDFYYTPVVSNGHIYIAAASNPALGGRQMEMLNQANGHQIWKKSFSSPIGGYVVVY